jgi:excisionase family DNA binding protein
MADLLTVPEVMERLHLSRSKVYDLIRSRRLTSITIDRSRRIPEDALADFIARLVEEVA